MLFTEETSKKIAGYLQAMKKPVGTSFTKVAYANAYMPSNSIYNYGFNYGPQYQQQVGAPQAASGDGSFGGTLAMLAPMLMQMYGQQEQQPGLLSQVGSGIKAIGSEAYDAVASPGRTLNTVKDVFNNRFGEGSENNNAVVDMLTRYAVNPLDRNAMGIQGVYGMVNDPSLMNAGMAALGYGQLKNQYTGVRSLLSGNVGRKALGNSLAKAMYGSGAPGLISRGVQAATSGIGSRLPGFAGRALTTAAPWLAKGVARFIPGVNLALIAYDLARAGYGMYDLLNTNAYNRRMSGELNRMQSNLNTEILGDDATRFSDAYAATQAIADANRGWFSNNTDIASQIRGATEEQRNHVIAMQRVLSDPNSTFEQIRAAERALGNLGMGGEASAEERFNAIQDATGGNYETFNDFNKRRRALQESHLAQRETNRQPAATATPEQPVATTQSSNTPQPTRTETPSTPVSPAATPPPSVPKETAPPAAPEANPVVSTNTVEDKPENSNTGIRRPPRR